MFAKCCSLLVQFFVIFHQLCNETFIQIHCTSFQLDQLRCVNIVHPFFPHQICYHHCCAA